ncbi:lipocalin-like domain-containing protein [Tenacibaculum caenipelagi]|uniref:Lipocalin-like protein n=1 Tax=Tenacibaculum caenipelagi TaxID=1325435 RepID=A0A4R6THS1_9FLAO|nr:lipocalin family protein [Tenacibaculum caenipelagi]TDQ29896.1 lipocalin-like protein [Tenacibaculum caenipelagi]
MKKIIALSILTVTLLSCSSNENTPLSDDIIIGKWQLIRQYGDDADECTKKSTMIFENDFDLIINTYLSLTDDECVSTGITKGNWNKKGENLYTLERQGLSIDTSIRFEDNNNTLIFLEEGEEELAYSRK